MNSGSVSSSPAPESFGAALKREWFSNVRNDLLSGAVVALALIPEAIAFSIVAGVDPKIGLYAAFTIAMLTGIFGGRLGMISAATAFRCASVVRKQMHRRAADDPTSRSNAVLLPPTERRLP